MGDTRRGGDVPHLRAGLIQHGGPRCPLGIFPAGRSDQAVLAASGPRTLFRGSGRCRPRPGGPADNTPDSLLVDQLAPRALAASSTMVLSMPAASRARLLLQQEDTAAGQAGEAAAQRLRRPGEGQGVRLPRTGFFGRHYL